MINAEASMDPNIETPETDALGALSPLGKMNFSTGYRSHSNLEN